MGATAHAEKIFNSGDSNDSLRIEQTLHLAEKYYEGQNVNYDSALIYLNQALDLSKQSGNELYTYKTYGIFARLLYLTDNYSLATDYNFKQLYLLDDKAKLDNDNLDIKREYVTLYRNIGISMNRLDVEKALDYFNKALNMLQEIDKIDSDYLDLERIKLSLYNNIGAAWIDYGDYEQASYYLEMALSHPTIENNKEFYASLYNNIGNVKFKLNDTEGSLEFFRHSLVLIEELGDKAGMANIYYNLGFIYKKENQLPEAIEKLNKSIELSRENNHIRIEYLAIQTLADIYELQKDYQQANRMMHLANELFNSIAGKDKVSEMARVELQYLLEKQSKENELKQQILISEREQRTLIVLLIAMFLFFMLIILFLLNRNLRIKNKKNQLEQESLSLQNENLELRNQRLEQSLDDKTRELNTHMKYLLNKNEFISSIIENVSDIKDKDPKKIKSTLKDMQLNLETSVWNEFNALFQDLHHDFYTKLYQAHPDLTSNEIRLCAFLRLNMATKEISSITLQSLKSIETARTRLRKKLNLNREISLSSYLSQF